MNAHDSGVGAARASLVLSDCLEEAMRRYARGEIEQFRVLHRQLRPRLHRRLLRWTSDDEQAADLTQETFLRMHRARHSYEPGRGVLPWAMTIARNAHLDAIRRRRRSIVIWVPADSLQRVQREPISREGDAESLAVARETASYAQRVLDSMPLASREAFELLRAEGLSVAEAAHRIGTTKTAVKLRAFRAYQAIRAALEPSQPGRGEPFAAANLERRH